MFFAIDDNILININRIDRVEQKTIGNVKVIAYVNGRRHEVKRDVERFLNIVKNTGKEETTRAW